LLEPRREWCVVEINNNRSSSRWQEPIVDNDARESRVNLPEGMLEAAEIIFSVLFSEKPHRCSGGGQRKSSTVQRNL